MSNSDLTSAMKASAEKVQAVVSDVQSLADIFSYTIDITCRQGGRTIVVPGLSEAETAGFDTMCREKGLELLVPPYRQHLTGIDTALTMADWGVAETGTLVINSASEDLRIATMLCETHVAFLPKAAIKPDMNALEDSLDGIVKDSPAYLAFITGPSRTADIERVLAIGVHGPKELHILLMEDIPQ